MKFATVVFSLNLMFLIMGILLGWGPLPLIFSGVGTLAGGLRLMEVNLSKKSVEARQSARETMDSVAEIENRKNKTVYDCRNYEDMTLQLRFVEAGIAERVDLPICENEYCPLCSPERERREDVSRTKKAKAENIRKVKIAVETKEKRERFENMAYASPKPLAENVWKAYKEKYGCFRGMSYYDYLIKYRTARDNGIDVAAIATDKKSNKPVELKKCMNCGMLTDNRLVCRPCMAKAAQMKRDLQAAEQKIIENRKDEARRAIVLPGGMKIVRPSHVPSFADVQYEYDNVGRHVGLYWTWSYDDEDKEFGVFQSFEDNEEITVDDKSILTHGNPWRENPCSDAGGHELAICDCDYEEVRVSTNKEVMRKYYRA